jgi:hypothetical protein
MTVLVNNAKQKTKRRWITLTEWPLSLIEAYDAGVLTGEAEMTAKALKSMTTHPWRRAIKNFRKPTQPAVISL